LCWKRKGSQGLTNKLQQRTSEVRNLQSSTENRECALHTSSALHQGSLLPAQSFERLFTHFCYYHTYPPLPSSGCMQQPISAVPCRSFSDESLALPKIVLWCYMADVRCKAPRLSSAWVRMEALADV